VPEGDSAAATGVTAMIVAESGAATPVDPPSKASVHGSFSHATLAEMIKRLSATARTFPFLSLRGIVYRGID
jgi:hypothetical protein